MPDTVLTLAARYRAQLDQQDTAALNRLIDTYQSMYARLKDKIELLAIDAEGMTWGKVSRLYRYRELREQIADELRKFGIFLESEIGIDARSAIGVGVDHSIGLMRAAGITGAFNRLPKNAVETLLGFLDPAGPLYQRIGQLAPSTLDKVIATLQEAVGLGYNPKKTARMIMDGFGNGLTDALRMTRTVQLYSYREATRAEYIASGQVTEWMWWAQLDERTCMSCVSQHGSIHPVTETLNDHHNGRCAMIPITDTYGAPDITTGEDWFNNLTEAQQKQMLGAGKFDAYKGGAFEFKDLSTPHVDPVYGEMRGETPLWALLGAEPPTRTK